MGPRDLSRAVRDDIRQVLGDPAARGGRLAESILALGARHPTEPFRAVLRCAADIDCAEDEARSIVLAIDGRRDLLERSLGRDPGFAVAACDLLHEEGRTLREPVFRQEGDDTPGWEAAEGADPAGEETWRLEARRAERSGRPLALVVLSPDPGSGPSLESMRSARSTILAIARDVDHVEEAPPPDLLVLMPCTAGREALRAAERFQGALSAATGRAWRAGVAVGRGAPLSGRALEEDARRSLAAARSAGIAATLHRLERRRHPRSSVGPALLARFRREGCESETVVEDLSVGGALLSLRERLDPGMDIVLALRSPSARPSVLAIPSRVVRVSDGPAPGSAPWRAAVVFPRDALLRIAGLLALLGAPDGGMSS